MKRYPSFTDQQARELAKATNDIVHRVTIIATMLVVALALGFGFGLWKIQDSSERADAANRAAAQVIRDRASDAKRLAAENQKNAIESAATAYAACRRQQESTIAARLAVRVMLANTDPRVHHLAVRYYHFLNAQHLLDLPQCPKPPAEGD